MCFPTGSSFFLLLLFFKGTSCQLNVQLSCAYPKLSRAPPPHVKTTHYKYIPDIGCLRGRTQFCLDGVAVQGCCFLVLQDCFRDLFKANGTFHSYVLWFLSLFKDKEESTCTERLSLLKKGECSGTFINAEYRQPLRMVCTLCSPLKTVTAKSVY